MAIELHGRTDGEFGMHYNMPAWARLILYLAKWGVDVREFTTTSDGSLISPATCDKVAAAFQAHRDEVAAEDREWIDEQAKGWGCMAQWGGAEQW